MRRRSPGQPTAEGSVGTRPGFALSENTITLRDVDPAERLRPEVVEIYQLGEASVDCTAETDADWLRVEVRGRRLVVHLDPRDGPNRGKVLVRDRRSGTAQALRVEAHVRRADVRADPRPDSGAPAGAVPPASASAGGPAVPAPAATGAPAAPALPRGFPASGPGGPAAHAVRGGPAAP